jgi:hypothetical protein
MKKIFFGWMMIFSVLFLGLVSCSKDDKNPEDKLSKDIQNFVSDETIQHLTDMGMVINKGVDPPDMEGEYLATPYELIGTTVANDYSLGTYFADYYFRLYDQDNDDLTIKLDYYNGGEQGSGLGGFISGSGNKFSVFIEVHSEYQGYKATLLHVLSGKMTDDGIEDFYFANYMLDNNGNEGGVWIENDEGRVLIDSNGMTPFTDYNFKSAKSAVNSIIPGAVKSK